jgi:hypothetical protein
MHHTRSSSSYSLERLELGKKNMTGPLPPFSPSLIQNHSAILCGKYVILQNETMKLENLVLPRHENDE